jgi:hypothetical protein
MSLSREGKSVTGQRSNQLNYVPTRQINEMKSGTQLAPKTGRNPSKTVVFD